MFVLLGRQSSKVLGRHGRSPGGQDRFPLQDTSSDRLCQFYLDGTLCSNLVNYRSNHQEPWDCCAWGSARNEATDRRLDCTRRTFTLATGGALPAPYRDTSIENSEIINLALTVAKALSFDLKTDGRSLP